MKNILKIFVFCLTTILLSNCSTDDKTIDNVFDNVKAGAILRTIKVNQANFDFNDTSSKWSVTVEHQGAAFSEVKVYATHTSAGIDSEEVVLKSIPASSFAVTGFNGYSRGEISTTLAETLAALGLTTGEYFSADKFNLRLELILTDGRKFSVDDSSPRVTGGTYLTSPFEYSAQFKCPLSNASIFNGNYKVTVDIWADYAPGDIVPVEYNGNDGAYTFRINNTNNPYVINSNTSYLIVTVNPVDDTVVVTSNETWDYGGGFTVNVTGKGTVGSCTGDINLQLNFSGSSQNQSLSLVKVN